MTLSRKHYNAVAEIIKKHMVTPTDAYYIRPLAEDLADLFQADNPQHFDRRRFLAACGVR
jgi:hypothetical protein